MINLDTAVKKKIIEISKTYPDITKAMIPGLVRKVFEVLKEQAISETVRVPGFGTFKTKTTTPRVCRNVYAGKKVNVPARIKMYFKEARR